MTSRFVLSRAQHSVEGLGVSARFATIDEARTALRQRSAATIVGILPFDVANDPPALVEPRTFTRSDHAWRAPAGLPALPVMTITDQIPAPDVHVKRVLDAIEVLRLGALQKVVLARSLVLHSEFVVDPMALLETLVSANPLGNGFAVDLSPAGSAYDGRHLVGASPELLVRRHGNVVACHPFAGTAARQADPVADAEAGEQLFKSAKDLAEHRFVLEEIKSALAPLCSELTASEQPELTGTPQVWHLSTPIRGVLRDTSTTALDLALALHPTAAVAGVPRADAMQAISRIEGPRGFYAGAVGWTDAEGDGEWMVAIRCAELSADGLTATATAGGGIVAASDPAAELEETTAKFRTILGAFGL